MLKFTFREPLSILGVEENINITTHKRKQEPEHEYEHKFMNLKVE